MVDGWMVYYSGRRWVCRHDGSTSRGLGELLGDDWMDGEMCDGMIFGMRQGTL